MAHYIRKRRTLHWPITLSAALMGLNVTLMICWIVLFAQLNSFGALAIGTVAFAVILVGLSFYLFLTIKEIQLNRRQANFVDSVTHELKTPIASLRLYLETLQLRQLETDRRDEFYTVMEQQLHRLDTLINQLLEVGRLDAVGHDEEPEELPLLPLLQQCARSACTRHQCSLENVFRFEGRPVVVNARPIVLEMIFGNLIDNAIKYGGQDPQVVVEVATLPRGQILVRIIDNGEGIAPELRKKIFRVFFRAGDELQRRQKGTGLGLYIARTLVDSLKGRIRVQPRNDHPGSVFEVELPGQIVE
ncbi:MAG: histidine kinase [Planctomycetaceae bacterium]|nr:histidine kinase [Planctomycetaceae bacterium]MDP7275677.1 HAMP domain-containing sensor histidine kinase [Planctomycetaceae bacterium]